jgi:hypothetical protein
MVRRLSGHHRRGRGLWDSGLALADCLIAGHEPRRVGCSQPADANPSRGYDPICHLR